MAVVAKCFNEFIIRLDCEFVERISRAVRRVQLRVNVLWDLVLMGVLVNDDRLTGNLAGTTVFCHLDISRCDYSGICIPIPSPGAAAAWSDDGTRELVKHEVFGERA